MMPLPVDEGLHELDGLSVELHPVKTATSVIPPAVRTRRRLTLGTGLGSGNRIAKSSEEMRGKRRAVEITRQGGTRKSSGGRWTRD